MVANGRPIDHPEVRSIALAITAALLAGLLALAAPAHADEAPFVEWTTLLPGMTDTYQPSSANDCAAGRSSCVRSTIREMQRRFAPIGKACDPNAVFALAYLRTTQTYEWARDQAGFFEDTPFVNHEDAVFARYYFEAYDDWAAGRRSEVTAAWLTAFDSARGHSVSGTGNLFLGMSAHVNRDLPFVLADIGLNHPDGSSRNADHDQVNKFLNAVLDPLLGEEAARFDPATDDARDPTLLGYTTTFQMLAAWRETAWRNAERLVSAPTPAARAQVAQSIEDYAAGVATVLKAATAYAPPFTTSAATDTWCRAHNGAAAPIAYSFGTPTPW
jgi:hypothetical protein